MLLPLSASFSRATSLSSILRPQSSESAAANRAPALGDLRHAVRELRVRHGPADIHAGAADRRRFRHVVLFVPGSGFDQARRLGQDRNRDYRLLSDAVLRERHGAQEATTDRAWPTRPSQPITASQVSIATGRSP